MGNMFGKTIVDEKVLRRYREMAAALSMEINACEYDINTLEWQGRCLAVSYKMMEKRMKRKGANAGNSALRASMSNVATNLKSMHALMRTLMNKHSNYMRWKVKLHGAIQSLHSAQSIEQLRDLSNSMALDSGMTEKMKDLMSEMNTTEKARNDDFAGMMTWSNMMSDLSSNGVDDVFDGETDVSMDHDDVHASGVGANLVDFFGTQSAMQTRLDAVADDADYDMDDAYDPTEDALLA